MKNIYLLCNFLLVNSLLLGQSPEKMSPGRLARIDAWMEQAIAEKQLNGAVAIVHRNNQLVYHKAFGLMDVKTQQAMPKDAIFRIASQTKAITATAIMLLYEEGRLLLDDPIEKYLPSFANPRVITKFSLKDTTFSTEPAKRSVRIRDLLTHTSGIGYAQIGTDTARALYAKYGLVGGIGVVNPRIRLEDQIETLGKVPLLHHPGARWTYGLNIDVLGRLVEVLSGMNLDAFLQKRLFRPLGLKDTHFYQPEANWSRIVPLHSNPSLGEIVKLPLETPMLGGLYTDYPRFQGTYYSGGAGLSSTAWDYAQFLQMLLNDGVLHGKRILARSSVRLMRTNQIGDIDFEMAGQAANQKVGFGFIINTEKAAGQSPVSVGTYYGGGAFYSIYWIDPKEKVTGQLMINMLPMRQIDVLEKFKVAVYQAIAD
jgi:CubicO group peptidase (beta-lactamase class C family)